MSEEHFSIRKQLEEMQQELSKVSKELTKLTVVNEMLHQERYNSSTKLDKLESEFTELKGGLTLLKATAGVFGASAVAFCTWIVSNNYGNTTAIQAVNERYAVLSEKVDNSRTDINQNSLALEKLSGK